MDTQSVVPSILFPQSYLKDDAAKHQDRKDIDLDRRHHQEDNNVDDNSRQQLQGLNELASDVYHRSPVEEQTQAMATTEMAYQSYASRTSHSAEIQVTTQEGDVITINIQELAESSKSQLQAEQGGNSFSLYNESSLSSSSFSLSIEGDLNQDELKSLNKLIKDITKVSDKFFDGNIDSAFKHAQKIGFDSDQISGFSMDLNRQKSVEAVAAYQQTTVPEQNINTDLLKQAADFLTETKNFLADANAMLDFLDQPQKGFNDLFAGIGQMQVDEQNPIEDSKGQQAFLDMVNNVSNDIFNEN